MLRRNEASSPEDLSSAVDFVRDRLSSIDLAKSFWFGSPD
jgi:hypothetical protein